MASIRSLPNGKKMIRWWSNNKQHSKTITGSLADARRYARDIEARQTQGPYYEAPPETLGAFLSHPKTGADSGGWLERQAKKLSRSTVERRRQALKALGFLDSDEYIANLRVAEVEAAALSAAPRQGQIGLAALKLALKDAQKKGQRFDSGLLTIEPPRYTPKERGALSWDEVEHLASFMPEHSRRLVLVAALTGLRQGELLSLQEGDLHLGKLSGGRVGNAVAVRTSEPERVPESFLRVRGTKTKASRRTVQLTPLAVELLREQLLARKHTADRLVFPAPQGGAWNPDNYMHRVFRPAAKDAGLEVDFHALRHTFVSLAAKEGVAQAVIEEMAGWSKGSAAEMYSRYRHVYSSEVEEGLRRLEAMVRRSSGERDAERETGA